MSDITHVGLDLTELDDTINALSHRVRELRRRLKRSNYEGKLGMKESVLRELDSGESVLSKLREAHGVLRDAKIEKIHQSLGLVLRCDRTISESRGSPKCGRPATKQPDGSVRCPSHETRGA